MYDVSTDNAVADIGRKDVSVRCHVDVRMNNPIDRRRSKTARGFGLPRIQVVCAEEMNVVECKIF